MTIPATPVAPSIGLEMMAQRFAAMERDAAEVAIDAYVAAAIREWRISDATFWQRIKFRSRMIRTAKRRQPEPPQKA